MQSTLLTFYGLWISCHVIKAFLHLRLEKYPSRVLLKGACGESICNMDSLLSLSLLHFVVL